MDNESKRRVCDSVSVYMWAPIRATHTRDKANSQYGDKRLGVGLPSGGVSMSFMLLIKRTN